MIKLELDSLPKDKILARTKLKTIAADKSKEAKNGKNLSIIE